MIYRKKPTEIQGVTAEEYLTNWLSPANYPVVDLDVTYESANGNINGKVTAIQSRFLLSEAFNPVFNPEPAPYVYIRIIHSHPKILGFGFNTHTQNPKNVGMKPKPKNFWV